MNKNHLKTILSITILMLFININSAISWAQEIEKQSGSPKIYTIYNISIDEKASTSNQASKAAIHVAQRIALDKLFRKIIRQEDQSGLNHLTNGQITELVSGFEVANEKSSRVRYIADFTIHFSRDKVYNFLSEQQIPFAETLSNPANIIAVLEKDGASFLWEQSNDWQKAWHDYDNANNLVPINVITPSLANRVAINPWQAQHGDMDALQDFADERNFRTLYVMSAQIINNLMKTSNTLELFIFKVAQDKQEYRTTISLDINTDDPTDLYNEAIKQATYWLDNQWKEKVMIHFGTSSHINVNIKFDSSYDWFEIKKKLESISLIRKITYNKFSIMATGVELEHSGDVKQIILTLEQEDLILSEETDNMDFEKYPWVLRLKKK